MSKLKHTPGPWVADLRSGCCAVYPKSRENETNGCHSYDDRNIHYSNKGAELNNERMFWSMDEEAQANARLIAAAPEMLEALIDMKRAFDPYNLGGDMYNGHHSAIEKCATVVEKATGMKIEEALK